MWPIGKAQVVKKMAKATFGVGNADASCWTVKGREEPKERARVSVGTCGGCWSGSAEAGCNKPRTLLGEKAEWSSVLLAWDHAVWGVGR